MTDAAPSDTFGDAFDALIRLEGAYSNDAADRGGETAYGITSAVALANGYEGLMRDLPLAVARRIYRAQYWDLLRLDDVATLSPRVAGELFDTAVNMGAGVSARFLQNALNALGAIALKPDGLIGPLTLYALRSYFAQRGPIGETVLLRALNGQQAAQYVAIAGRDPSQQRFVYGQIKNRVAI